MDSEAWLRISDSILGQGAHDPEIGPPYDALMLPQRRVPWRATTSTFTMAHTARDDEGSDFHSLDAAVQAATRSPAEIGTDRLAKGDTSDVVIGVRDEHNQRICTIKSVDGD